MPRKPPPKQWGNRHFAGKGKRRFLLPKRARERVAKLLSQPKLPHPRHQLALTNPYGVAPGQVWLNVDSRAGINSKAGPVAVKVHRVDPPYALCYWVGVDGSFDPSRELRPSRIRLDMFRPREPRKTRWGGGGRGWRLKEEP